MIKDEPSDGEDDAKDDLHAQLGFNMDSGGPDDMADDSYESQHLMSGDQPQTFDDVIGQSMPGPSGLQQVCDYLVLL